MKIRFVKFILTGIMCSICFLSKAQQKQTPPLSHSFSAKEAVDYAMSHAVQVKNALLDIKIQEQTNKGYTAEALPHISASSSINYNPNVTVLAFPDFISPAVYGVLAKEKIKDGNGNPITVPTENGLFYAPFGSKYSLVGGIDINQILFDGQVFVGLQARKTAMKNAELTADVTKEQIKTNVYKIYYQLVVAKRQIGTLNANIANYEKLLHDTKEIYKNGFAEKLDVDKVQVQLSNLKTQKLQAQNQIDAGKEGLKFLMNIPQHDQIILTDTLSDEEIKSNILDENYNYEDRKEYQVLESSIELGKYNVKRYQLSKLPSLSLVGNYSQNTLGNSFDFLKGPYFASSYIGLRLSVPIFDGGTRNSNIATARFNLMKLNNQLDQLKSSIDNDAAQSRINFKTALLTMDTQEKNVDLAESVYNSTKLKYEQGVGSNQEISTAQADLVTAQNNYYSSLYDAVIAKIDFLTAAGKL
ncbi:MAG TPA: TolC family protein [Hanamia sp.]|nr:TolC family protein [Hanamia sp.]